MFRQPMTNRPKNAVSYKKHKPIKEKESLPWSVTAFLIVLALQPFVMYDKFREWIRS